MRTLIYTPKTLSKFTKVSMILVLFFLSLKVNAQCSASFIAIDSSGYGYITNTSVGTGITCTWSFGDGSSATSTGLTTMTHLYTSPGNYYVCLSITDFLGTCTDTFCDSLIIGMPGTGTSGACLGIVTTNYTYTDSSGYAVFNNTVTGSSPVYFWDYGDGTTSSIAGNNSHLYSANGNYLVCLTVYETGTGSDSCQYCNYVSINSLGGIPSCSASFIAVQDSSNLYNYYVYNTSVVSGTTNYLWDFGDGTTSSLAYPTHTYTDTTSVLLCLTITDGPPALACTSTFCDSIINPGRSSGVFTISILPMGVNEETTIISSIENFPNPFSENTTINYSINKDAIVSLSIVDLLGNTIMELENESKESGSYSTNWNAEKVAGGMYLLQLKVNNTISTRKLIVSK